MDNFPKRIRIKRYLRLSQIGPWATRRDEINAMAEHAAMVESLASSDIFGIDLHPRVVSRMNCHIRWRGRRRRRMSIQGEGQEPAWRCVLPSDTHDAAAARGGAAITHQHGN